MSERKVLIYGAGSIGNHLAQACRRIGWNVVVCDSDPAALDRMKSDIYPTRYGAWDDDIRLILPSEVDSSVGMYDVIMVGTPPDSHLNLAREALSMKPQLLHIEKPLGTPQDDFVEFSTLVTSFEETMVTVGYDHAVAESVAFALGKIREGVLGEVLSVNAMTREHWHGIFNAHPWLAGPHDSYLGYWKRGGGALCEHSHALHLGLAFADAIGWKAVLNSAVLDIVKGEHGEEYDQLGHLLFHVSEGNGLLSVTHDVITRPSIKGLMVVGTKGRLELSLSPLLDTVQLYRHDEELETTEFKKTRPDDFHALVRHYDALLEGRLTLGESPIRLDTGLEVMRIIKDSFARQKQ